MRPTRLQLTNFAAYKDAELKLEPGLYVLSGVNGSGKSSLLDAITFAIWNKARSPISTLARFGTRPVEVVFEFDESGNEYRIIRSISVGGSLQFFVKVIEDGEERWESLSGRRMDETQAEIEKIVKLSYDTFLCTSFFKQGKADLFMVGTPAERKKVLEEILQINQWELWAASVRKQGSAVNLEATKLKEAIKTLRAQLSESGSELHNEIEKLQNQREEKNSAFLKNALKLSQLEKDEKEKRLTIWNLHKESTRFNELIKDGEALARLAKGEYQREQKRLSEVEEGICPVCLGPLGPEAKERVQKEVANWPKEDQQKWISWGGLEKLKTLRSDYQAIEAKLAALESETQELSKICVKGNTVQSNLQSAIQQKDIEIAKFRVILENEDKVKQQIQEKEKELREVEAQLEVLKITAKVFSRDGVPANLLRFALPSIEEEANKILEQLTQGRFTVEFRTGGGDKRETLEVDVQDGAYVRPYETYSGGEQFRINFAIRVALSMVLARMRGSSVRFLVLDEGFGSLDDEGKRLLVESVLDIQSLFDIVLTISHIPDIRDALVAGGATLLEVVPGPEGSVIEY